MCIWSANVCHPTKKKQQTATHPPIHDKSLFFVCHFVCFSACSHQLSLLWFIRLQIYVHLVGSLVSIYCTALQIVSQSQKAGRCGQNQIILFPPPLENNNNNQKKQKTISSNRQSSPIENKEQDRKTERKTTRHWWDFIAKFCVSLVYYTRDVNRINNTGPVSQFKRQFLSTSW